MTREAQETPVVDTSSTVSETDAPRKTRSRKSSRAKTEPVSETPAAQDAPEGEEAATQAKPRRARQPRTRQAKPRQRSSRRKAAEPAVDAEASMEAAEAPVTPVEEPAVDTEATMETAEGPGAPVEEPLPEREARPVPEPVTAQEQAPVSGETAPAEPAPRKRESRTPGRSARKVAEAQLTTADRETTRKPAPAFEDVPPAGPFTTAPMSDADWQAWASLTPEENTPAANATPGTEGLATDSENDGPRDSAPNAEPAPAIADESLEELVPADEAVEEIVEEPEEEADDFVQVDFNDAVTDTLDESDDTLGVEPLFGEGEAPDDGATVVAEGKAFFDDDESVPFQPDTITPPDAEERLSDTSEVGGEQLAEESGEEGNPALPGEEEQSRPRKSRRGKRGGRRGGRAGRKAREREAELAAEQEAAPNDDGQRPEAELEPAPEEMDERPSPAPERPDGEDLPSNYVRKNTGRRRMYISILSGEQVEVAITNNGLLDEYYLDMLHQKKIKGNIYRGVIHNIDSNLQAAFVDFGAEKNGFLQIDEIHPEYYITHHEPTRGKKFPPIQKVLRIGQEVLVQVVKEPNGTKGAFLTTWISLAGRFLVLTPGLEQIGISRKVNDEEERARLRELMTGIDPGEDLGVIVRTVSAGVTRATLQADLLYLKRTWTDVRARATEVTAPACVYKEPSLPERAIRDYLTDDVCEVWVDDVDVARDIRDTVALLFPNKKDLVRLHTDPRHSMWERFNLRRQLDQIYSREVLMPSGGRLVFDQTEALMAIDINSGRITGKGNFEAMAFRTNLEAAETIARQLKLRDIGGQVVIDFIEMREHKHVAEVEKTLRNAMRNDRARHDVAHMSSFGLLELVRQRTGTSAISISMEPCPACGGTGLRRNLEWQSLQALRELARQLRSRNVSPCQFELPQELALYLLNHKRDALKDLENQYEKNIEIVIKA